ncbi:MAG: SDR family NAD(P)-dependent oxidoreductase [Acidimicrobiales bacterium]|nr:SDR family NAD(P)-dependent oxidoreductase [Acidimicrobiales bacterium]
MTDHVLAGRRVLVVGASSGIGAALAKGVIAAGGDVTVSARRAEALDALVEEMGAGHAAPGDATLREDMDRVAATAVEKMGGLDLMVYVAGYGPLQKIDECDPDLWVDVFRVNVCGANLAAAAALAHMDRDGVCAFVSSRTVEDANPYFGAYSSTKTALDQCIRVWRLEKPDQRFIRVVMGNCMPTDFANHMGFDLLGDALTRWGELAIPGGVMHVDDVGAGLAESLGVVLDHPEIDSSEIKFDARPDPGQVVGEI